MCMYSSDEFNASLSLLKPDDVYQNFAVAAAVVVILQLLHEFLDKPEPSEPRLLETSSCPSSYSSHPLYVRHPLWDKVHPQYPYYYFDEKSMIIVKREEETECHALLPYIS